MNGRHADLSAGERTDVEVEFVSRRTVETDGKRVHRLLVEDDDGDRFAVLVAPDSGLLLGLKTGARYEFSDLLASQPVERAGEDGFDCPDCGGRLRGGTVADAVDSALAAAATALGLGEPFGIVDEQTTTERVSGEGGFDGERETGFDGEREKPDSENRNGEHESRAGALPDLVCESCGRHVDEREHRPAGHPDSQKF